MNSDHNFSDYNTWSVSSIQTSRPASNSKNLMEESCVDAPYTGVLAMPEKYPKRNNKYQRKPTIKVSSRYSVLVERPFKRKKDRRQTKLEKALTSKNKGRGQTKLERKLGNKPQYTPDEDQLKKKSSIWQPEFSENPIKKNLKVTSTKVSKKPKDSSDSDSDREVKEPKKPLARNTIPENHELNWVEWLTMKEVGKAPKPLQDFSIKLSPYAYSDPEEEPKPTRKLRMRRPLNAKMNLRRNLGPGLIENSIPQQVLPKAPIPAPAVEKKLVPPTVLPTEDKRPESLQKNQIDVSPETIKKDSKESKTEVSRYEGKFDETLSHLNNDKDLSHNIPANLVPPAAFNAESSPRLMMLHSPKPYTEDYARFNHLARDYEQTRHSRKIDSCISIGNHSDGKPLRCKGKARGHKKNMKKKPKVLKQKATMKLRKKVGVKKRLGKRSMEAVNNSAGRSWISKWIWPDEDSS